MSDVQTATEPSAAARQMAKMLWDNFRALIQQGFTETQALTVLGVMMGTAIAGQNGDSPGQR
jgi:hypothetical protein